jgi:sporulation protein YlmC with PRC-barrel domain
MFRFSPKSRLTARTRSGTQLGKVMVVEIDEATGRIATFLVAANGLLSVLSDKTLAIAWSQIVDWQGDEIVVDDAVERLGAANLAVANPATPRTFAKDAAASLSRMDDCG